MGEMKRKVDNAARRSARTRATLHGTAERPRLSVTISNKHVSAQLINDDESKTLLGATSAGTNLTGTMTDRAVKVGADIAAKAKKQKITKVVFDRGAKQYHGRIKALADAARENGLEF